MELQPELLDVVVVAVVVVAASVLAQRSNQRVPYRLVPMSSTCWTTLTLSRASLHQQQRDQL